MAARHYCCGVPSADEGERRTPTEAGGKSLVIVGRLFRCPRCGKQAAVTERFEDAAPRPLAQTRATTC